MKYGQYVEPSDGSREAVVSVGRKLLAAAFVIGCIVLLTLWTRGDLSTGDALQLTIIVGCSCLILAAVVSIRQHGFGSGAFITPQSLRVKSGMNWFECPWEDVVSVYTPRGTRTRTGRFLMRILYGPEADELQVAIKLRRFMKIPFWGTWMSTRAWGIPTFPGREVGVFLDEPEPFVRDAQQFLKDENPSDLRPA